MDFTVLYSVVGPTLSGWRRRYGADSLATFRRFQRYRRVTGSNGWDLHRTGGERREEKVSKYGHHPLEWFERIVDRLGGEEAAERFLRGEPTVTEPESGPRGEPKADGPKR